MPDFSVQMMRACQWIVRLGLGVLLLTPMSLLAVEPLLEPPSAVPQTQTIGTPAPQSGIPPTEVADGFDTMQAPRDYLSGKVTSFASYIDRFFGGGGYPPPPPNAFWGFLF